ncbi:MAG TPA: hypothetical protein VNN08_02335 [Thermoanaerobaculia bacterium]|nr:hypothetical protein [Thermoanaerobaculia bacterium]
MFIFRGRKIGIPVSLYFEDVVMVRDVSKVLLLFFCFTVAGTPAARALDRDAAYQLLNQRAAENRQSFFVYQDGDAGANHGFASGFFGSFQKIAVDSACIDDAAAANGCSTDPTRLDQGRGTVLRMSFQALDSIEFAGVNFEEPENWGANKRGIGYDLRGATAVVFEVRSPTPGGISVQFGVDTRTTAFMFIPQSASFQTITIPLSSFAPDDFSNVHVLFTVVTNGTNAPNGGTLLLDNIRFTPAPTVRQSALGFPLATQTFGVVPVQNALSGRVPIPPDQANRNATTIYESALVLQALLDRGTSDDQAHARIIADTFFYAAGHPNHGQQLPTATDGSQGLYSGYENGDVALLNDQSPAGAQAGDVRFAGFSASTQQCGPSGYCPILNDATGGNNAFAILGLLASRRSLGDSKYLDVARTIGKWIYANLRDSSTSGFGGYLDGYPAGATANTHQRSAKTTENNADIFVAFTQLAAADRQYASDDVGAAEWDRRAAVAGDFVMQMFNSTDGRFNAGTVTTATPASDGIVPNGAVKGNDRINTFDFLDANTSAVLALARAPAYTAAIDWRRPVDWLAKQAVTVTSGGKTRTGFSLVAKPFGGPAGIAWEFTGQAIVAMRIVDCLYGETRFASQGDSLLPQMAEAQNDSPFGDGSGVVASTLEGGETLPPREQCLSTPFQCIPARVGLAATVWSVFADAGLNPLSSIDTLKVCPAYPRRRAVRR